MIRTANQLKAKVRNLSGSDSQKAQTLIRNFIMERFLERITLSRYQGNFVLKGGMLEATLERLRQAIKVDISTGDIITPGAVQFSYPLMFEDRSISLWTYNMETLLAEKLETIMARGTANTRMRDFYDIHVISGQRKIDDEVLKIAFAATSKKRKTFGKVSDFESILQNLENDNNMKMLWENYRNSSFFVGEVLWTDVMTSVKRLAKMVL